MDPRIDYNGTRQAQSSQGQGQGQGQMGVYQPQHHHGVNVIPHNEGQPAHMQQQQYMQSTQIQTQMQMQTMQAAVAHLHPPPPPPPLSLPPGWITATDPVSGRIYYANPTTGQTSWEPPVPVPVPIPVLVPVPVALPAPQIMAPPPQPSGMHMNMNMNMNHSMSSTSNNNNNPGSNMMGQPSSYEYSSSLLNTTMNMSMPMKSSLSLNAAHLLIPSTRAIVNKIHSEQKEDTTTDTSTDSAELHMSAGKIADLSHIQTNYRHEIMYNHMENTRKHDIDAKYAYEPLKPFSLPVTLVVPHVEGGRVDIRLMTLMETLGKIEKSSSKGTGTSKV